MKPVLVLQHLSIDAPAYLGTWLRAQGVDADVRNADAGQDYPSSMRGFGALAVLGAAALWFHYGTAVFFEMIAAGIAACF